MEQTTRVTEKEYCYVKEVLDTQFRNSRAGGTIRKLEETFAKTFGVSYAIALVNGTATLHTALFGAGVSPGDEVIVPPLTMASTALAVLQIGATPIFVDVDPLTFNLDPKKIEGEITKNTKAIMPVSLFGLSPDFDPILEIAKRHNLFVIEDDAQCFLGKYKDRLVGSVGDIASFSFQLSKHITCGEGGMVVTNNEELAGKMRCFSTLGYGAVLATPGKGKITKDKIQDPQYDRHVMVGWNYRISEVAAAVALAQVERLQELVEVRVQSARLYSEAVRGCSWLVPQAVPESYVHSYWTYVLKLENEEKFSWYDFRKKYVELGGDSFYACWKPNYLEPVFQSGAIKTRQAFRPGLCPVTEDLQKKLLQFKTNYYDPNVAEQKAEALAKTIRYFGE